MQLLRSTSSARYNVEAIISGFMEDWQNNLQIAVRYFRCLALCLDILEKNTANNEVCKVLNTRAQLFKALLA